MGAYFTIQDQVYEWHIGEPLPPQLFEARVVTVQLDGDELDFLRDRIEANAIATAKIVPVTGEANIKTLEYSLTVVPRNSDERQVLKNIAGEYDDPEDGIKFENGQFTISNSYTEPEPPIVVHEGGKPNGPVA